MLRKAVKHFYFVFRGAIFMLTGLVVGVILCVELRRNVMTELDLIRDKKYFYLGVAYSEPKFRWWNPFTWFIDDKSISIRRYLNVESGEVVVLIQDPNGEVFSL